jgi:endonuclease/exonuclease/phosphatase family metal-dependent hydrolase
VPDLTIASFNTHRGLRPRLRSRRATYDMTAALASLDADLIVVQEHWRPDGKRGAVDDAADALGLTVCAELIGRTRDLGALPHISHKGEGTESVAVLTRLPMQRLGSIPLGPTPGDPAPSRTALVVEIDVDGAPLRLVAVHLTSRLPHGPVLQLRQLARGVRTFTDGRPSVIVGDCNFWGPGVRAVMRGWRRAVTGRTWPAHRPHSQIDHVLVSSEIKVRRAEVLPDVGSDHRPVRVELQW